MSLSSQTDDENSDSSNDSSHDEPSNILEFNIIFPVSVWQCIKPENVLSQILYNDNRVYSIFPQGWTHLINDKIWEPTKLPCAYSFKNHHFYKSVGYPYFDFNASCKECKAQ